MTDSAAGSTPPVVSFATLCALARSRLPERLRWLRLPAEDVGDVVHDVLLVAYPKLGQFRPRRLGSEGEVDTDRALLAWLVGIAWRRVSRERRRGRSRREVSMGDVGDLTAAGAGPLTPEELADRAQHRALALEVLGRLRPERAEVLVLHEVGELSVPEIAGRLKVNTNTAKSRLHRARHDVRAVVRRMDPGRGAGGNSDAECGTMATMAGACTCGTPSTTSSSGGPTTTGCTPGSLGPGEACFSDGDCASCACNTQTMTCD